MKGCDQNATTFCKTTFYIMHSREWICTPYTKRCSGFFLYISKN
jgi:hypothetical protein